MLDIGDTNVSHLDMVPAFCGAGEKGHKQAVTCVRGTGVDKGPAVGAPCTVTQSKLKKQGEKWVRSFKTLLPLVCCVVSDKFPAS